MMTAPSTMSPKSSAPRLIRFAEVRVCNMPVSVINIATGMTAAVISAARKLPSSRKRRSEEHTSELQSLMRISYAVFCLKKKKTHNSNRQLNTNHENHTNKLECQQHYTIVFDKRQP